MKYPNVPFNTRLMMLLTELDQRNSKRADYNRYALGHYFRAAENVTDVYTFMENFTPTRQMHRLAKDMGFNLDVVFGEWVLLDSNGDNHRKEKG